MNNYAPALVAHWISWVASAVKQPSQFFTHQRKDDHSFAAVFVKNSCICGQIVAALRSRSSLSQRSSSGSSSPSPSVARRGHSYPGVGGQVTFSSIKCPNGTQIALLLHKGHTIFQHKISDWLLWSTITRVSTSSLKQRKTLTTIIFPSIRVIPMTGVHILSSSRTSWSLLLLSILSMHTS